MNRLFKEYLKEEDENPANIILSVSELVRKDADSEDEVAKTSIPYFLMLLKNAGLPISYAGLKSYYNAHPELKNVIQTFNDSEIVFVGQGDEKDGESLGEPQGEVPPEEVVDKMAKRAMKAREQVELDEVSPNKPKSDVIVMKKGQVEKSVVGASAVKKAEKEGFKIQYALLKTGKKVTDPKGIMKAIKSADKLGIGEEVELDEDGDEFGKFQDYARLYGGGDEIYVVTQGKDSNSQKVIGIEKDPNKAKKIRDGAKGSKASIYGQMKKSQKTFKLKVGDPVSFEDSKNKLSFIEEVDLDEDIATMAMVVMGLNAAALLPVLFMSVREIIRGTPLESSIKNVVDKLKKNKNYKMSDSEKSDVKGFVSKVKKDKPSLLQKAVKQAKLNLLKDQSHEEVEEGAAADARRAMRNDPDMKQRAFSKDVSSTDDDEKAASKNIMMQLRKAVSLRSYDVEFADGKKQKVDQRIAQAVQNKYNKMRRPADKEKFQAQIAKSYKDMLKTIKSGYGEQKESILEKIDRKIKENKNG